MLKLFKTILKTGEATLKYPFEPAPVSDNFRGKPVHHPGQCIACAACAIACPSNALSIDTDTENATRTWTLNVGRCIFCARCEEVCPTKAIALSKEFELAVANKGDLVQTATFNLARCTSCDKPFAPLKEVEYAIDLLRQSGISPAAVEARRTLMHTCTDCKRRQSLPMPLRV
ncbi:MAG: 4Fe-4S dicluster domain-containing protein [Burkholderiaceae bacterium]|jgi:formate hydrogenlyase subunit 6/NADH:ubiquinone oxidoreductase subunit I|nr:4Fe-4S dicluster domain-containing protein [Burkholderiaceae bacterium]